LRKEHGLRHTGAVRIALVHYTSLPVIGGVEVVLAAHARLFAQAGHDVTVLAGKDTRPGDATEAHAELAAGRAGAGFARAVEARIAVLRPILAAQDVVMLHNVATMHFDLVLTAALWRLAEELAEVRFICWVHDLAACNADYAGLPMDREPWALLGRAHPRYEYVAVSELRRREFSALTGQPPERCRTIPNGVETSQLLDLSPQAIALANEHRLFERDIVLAHPARLLRRKNVELTLRVIAALKAAGHSSAALITGPPEVQSGGGMSYAREIRALHEELGLEDDVFFLNDSGPLGMRELRNMFQLADALFFPSWQEGFGIPLLEAALHRLPIFCSDIEPLRGLLARGVVTFPPAARPEEIAALIAKVVARNDAAAARKQTLREYSWEAIHANFLSPLLTQTDTH
jgi:glycosyltransferase involved in cell wall biosynthesis